MKHALTRQAVINVYRRYAPVYDLLFGGVLGPGRTRMARMAGQASPSRILEIGIGTGLSLSHYPADSRVVGIDLSPEMLQRARLLAAHMPARDITLVEMDAEELAFADHSFDCVTIPYVLSVTPNPDRLVREAMRVCTPGGRIYVVNHFSGSRGWWLLERMIQSFADRVGFRSYFDFDRHIVSHPWKVLSVERVNLLGLSRLVAIENA